jgi:glutamate dehydrogenase (NAD(P)+)
MMDIENEGLRVAVQGIGNVGFYFAQIAERELGVKIVAVANSEKMIENRKGLKFGGLRFERNIIQKLKGTIGASEDIMSVDADVLVFAALGEVVTASNQKLIKAPIVLELANGPVDDDALQLLEDRGVHVIPDIVANAGGVIVSYLEILQNKGDAHWSYETVVDELDGIMTSAMGDVIGKATEFDINMKEAAYALAIQRLIGEDEYDQTSV